ncbi:hypothetical protein AVEN_53394-1 [Araneus ventricosus]|uniref:Uncharacterized protein n=1 Tax=Araneus ventricosus TaxID=182803 RepID=A0A4Y2ABR2_ARAVE|nr:hypothetical protein AVEN_53394-1 [Araneus ventricosus]
MESVGQKGISHSPGDDSERIHSLSLPFFPCSCAPNGNRFAFGSNRPVSPSVDLSFASDSINRNETDVSASTCLPHLETISGYERHWRQKAKRNYLYLEERLCK